MNVNEIRKREFEGESKEVVAFLLKQVDLARASAIGYAAVTIMEDICHPDECDDIMGWRQEAIEAGIVDEAQLVNAVLRAARSEKDNG